MPLIFAFLMIAVGYSFVTLLLLPFLEARWKHAAPHVRLAKAGAIAGLTTLQSFLQIALIVFGATFLVLTFLSTISPVLGAGALIALHRAVAAIAGVLTRATAASGAVFLWIAAAALFWLAWRARRDGLRTILEEEYKRQFDAILAKAQTEGLDELPPTADMQRLLQQLALVDDGLASAEGQSEDERKRLIAVRDEIIGRWVSIDISRRVDLTKIAIERPGDTRVWPRIRLAVFSRGTQKLNKQATRWLGKLTSAVACFLVVGISAPAVAALGLVPTLDRLADIQILRNEALAQKNLEALTGRKPESEPQATTADADAQVYQHAAQHFVRALAHDSLWHDAVDRSLPTHAALTSANAHDQQVLDNLALRDSILREYVAQAPAEGLEAASPGAFEGKGTAAEQDFDSFRRRRFDAAGTSDGAVSRVSSWLRVRGEQSPVFRARLRAGMASFREPAEAWDFASSVLGKGLSAAVDNALPDPHDKALFERNFRKSGDVLP